MVLRTSFRKGDDWMEYLLGQLACDVAVYLSKWNVIPQVAV
jgi:hypothetical protein